MKRHLFSVLVACLMVIGACAKSDVPMVVAHRGAWIKNLIPENSLDGIQMARRFGIGCIECDVKYTSDKVMVVMHDATINRTMRNAKDYSEIQEPVKVSEKTFAELRKDYVLASDDPAYRKPIPTLEEMLLECKKYDIVPMLHSHLTESYEKAQEVMGDKWVCFMSDDILALQARKFSGCLVLLDPGTDTVDNVIKRLERIGRPCGISTMKYKMLDKNYIAPLRRLDFEVQSSIFPTPHEMQSIHDGVSIVLSDFSWSQEKIMKKCQTDKWNWKGSLQKGEKIETTMEQKPSLGAMTLQIMFEGKVRIAVNGERTYEVEHDRMDSEHAGWRMNDTKAHLVIEAMENTLVKKAQAKFYAIP